MPHHVYALRGAGESVEDVRFLGAWWQRSLFVCHGKNKKSHATFSRSGLLFRDGFDDCLIDKGMACGTLMFVRISEMNYTRSRGEPGLDSRSTLPLFSPHDLIDIFEGAETAEFQELEHRS